MSYLQQAFEHVCEGAVKRNKCYLSIYEDCPYYGGPEEGGWWGHDTLLVASKDYPTEDAARQALDAVHKFANELQAASERAHGERCLHELEWLESRGLDADFLPEPDGPSDYWVTIEDRPGANESRGSRHYE
jgi:hypothetical protein